MDALRITISYPILYEPIYDKINECYVVDGALLSQYLLIILNILNQKLVYVLNRTKIKRYKKYYFLYSL